VPRSLWKGSIAFGLVQIPVAMHPALKGEELSFTMLDKRNFAPVGYERVNKKTGRKVEWSDVVKGYAPEPERLGAVVVDLAALLAQSVSEGGKKRRGRSSRTKASPRKARAHRPLRKAG
jgi:non-homologous end joining protein Ku